MNQSDLSGFSSGCFFLTFAMDSTALVDLFAFLMENQRTTDEDLEGVRAAIASGKSEAEVPLGRVLLTFNITLHREVNEAIGDHSAYVQCLHEQVLAVGVLDQVLVPVRRFSRSGRL